MVCWQKCPLACIILILIFFFYSYYSREIISYDHIYVTRSFFYKNSSIYGSQNTSTVVILLNMDLITDTDALLPVCTVFDQFGIAQQKTVGKTKRLMDGLNLGDCGLTIYRIVCHSLDTDNMSKVGLSIKNSPTATLKLMAADNQKRNFVICPGRIFAFDKWHLLVTALEIYRIHKVDLILVYIHSVDSEVFKLLNYYLLDGLIQYRPSLNMPSKVEGLEFNPNSETTFLHQLVNFQDCLYEFRESAQFIAFPDWDDIILTSNFSPLANAMEMAAITSPNTASFILYRYAAVFPTLKDMSLKNTTINEVWEDELYFGLTVNNRLNGKAIVRPSLVESVGQHDTHYWRDNFTEDVVPPSNLFAIHVRQGCHPCASTQEKDTQKTTILETDRMKLPNVTLIAENFIKFSNKYSLSTILSFLPKQEKVIDKFNDCIESMYEPEWKNLKRCRTYVQCKIPKIKKKCINVRNQWKSKKFDSDETIMLILQSSTFEEDDECLI